jgi:hypothetical protein
MANVTLTLRNMIHPLDKVFEGIPAGSLNFPGFSEVLQKPLKFS